ncbi:MAG: hypothetical protein EP332_06855 [Bacteroidetes bacterium]|nr:MAG: hypothetical protein EP332_06855 [Bacteroidota bacterium]
MNNTYSKAHQLRRKVNLVIQTSLVALLFTFGIHEVIPLKLIIWQLLHFSFIAIADYYLDDFPGKKRRITLLLLISYLAFLGLSLGFGIFDELYIRIHGIILILGNLLGNKVDKPFWKVLTLLNLVILVAVELM